MNYGNFGFLVYVSNNSTCYADFSQLISLLRIMEQKFSVLLAIVPSSGGKYPPCCTETFRIDHKKKLRKKLFISDNIPRNGWELNS